MLNRSYLGRYTITNATGPLSKFFPADGSATPSERHVHQPSLVEATTGLSTVVLRPVICGFAAQTFSDERVAQKFRARFVSGPVLCEVSSL